MARVELQVGGGTRPASGTSSWTLDLDTRTLANGAHDLTIRAVDGSGNVATAGIALTVANPRALERFVSPEGVVVDVDSAGGWSAEGIYQMLRESARDLDLIGPGLRVVVQDTGATAYTGGAAVTEGRCRQGAQTIWFNGFSGSSALHPERALAHEYGHAWSRYWLCEAQQLDWSAHLDFRGIASDPRLDSSYPTWSRDEIVAEDYRAAFGSPMAQDRESGFTNGHLPFDPGLPDFLAGVWSRR